MINKKWFTGVRLLVKSPSDFVSALRHKVLLKISKSHLRFQKLRAKKNVVWIDHGWAKLPFYDDGDIQELLYDVYGDEWYSKELAVLQPHVGSGDTVLDIGANVGFITIILANLVGEKGSIHSFEPSLSVRTKLNSTVIYNKLLNVTIHPYACGTSSDCLELWSPTGSSGNATLVGGLEGGERVNVVRLDDYLNNLVERVDFIKIDTEGFEDRVLAGAVQLVERFKPTIYIELSQEYRESSLAAIHWLKDRGYRFPIEPDLDKSHNGDNFIATCRD